MFARKPASVSAAEGARAADEGRVVVYWRKGCPFCKRLQLVLGKRVDDVVWVDVWADADLLLKVKEPVEEEYHRLRAGQTLFTYLHLAADRPQTEALLAAGTTAVLCTHGAAGASVVTADGWVEVPASPVGKVLDTNGAGDAFFAGFASAWVGGLDVAACAARGADRAAAAVGSWELA